MSFKNSKLISINTSPRDYFKQDHPRGHPQFIMSVSGLKEFIECPAKFLANAEDEATVSKDWGSLVDCLMLVPDQFNERYAVTPDHYPDRKTGELKDWAPNATYCKDWKNSRKESGIEVIKRSTYDEALKAVGRLRADNRINTFVNDSDKQVWMTAEWHDEATGLIVPFRIMLDLRPRNDSEYYQNLGDMKAIVSAALIPFQRQVFKYSWHIQGAVYTDIYRLAHPKEDRNTWCFVIQENKPPYQPGRRYLTENFFLLGQATYRKAMANYCQCLKSGKWPDYDDNDEATDGWSPCAPEPWMEQSGLFSPQYDFATDEDTSNSEKGPDEENIDLVP